MSTLEATDERAGAQVRSDGRDHVVTVAGREVRVSVAAAVTRADGRTAFPVRAGGREFEAVRVWVTDGEVALLDADGREAAHVLRGDRRYGYQAMPFLPRELGNWAAEAPGIVRESAERRRT